MPNEAKLTRCGLLGIYEHLENNFKFALEIRPNAVLSNVFWESLSGANPLLAPGILALAATYYQPELSKK
jgi:hypothetical protein